MKGFRGPFELQAGQCPSIPYQDQFIPSRLKGRWYKHLYIDSFFDQDSICQGIDISPFVNGKTNIVFFDYSNLSKLRSRIVVEAHFDHSRITNQLHAPGFGIMEKELHILDTDYDNYFIIIGCEEFGNQHLLQVWVDTRKPYPNMNMTEKVAQVMNEKGFRSVNLVEVNNKNCGFSPF
ncbi:apolipoprotein D-like [Cotesia typhae]|uniref:apolipoprotein D-like n=1 Tax=Cotesia typhae TaxID=2053667 RepID=UPI003D681298